MSIYFAHFVEVVMPLYL